MTFKALDLDGNEITGDMIGGKYIVIETPRPTPMGALQLAENIKYFKIQPDTLKVSFDDENFYSIEEIKERLNFTDMINESLEKGIDVKLTAKKDSK